MSQLEIFDLIEKSPLAESVKALQGALLAHELALWKSGFQHIAGVDEVGRGPLAGPVVACACILPKGVVFHGIQDSKSLSCKERSRLSDYLTSHPDVHWSLSAVSHEIIDEINILRATLLAMKQAVESLKQRPDFVLVDGRDTPPVDFSKKAVIRGDAVSQSIGAASIIAKVYRDKLMDDYHKQYPEYGFDKHKGYGTQYHRNAIDKYGLSPIHRKTFGSAKTLVAAPTLF
ncbi:MAG: ribonuclease HII [Chlamydiales bacterium]|nr:ribonuclease HII [Chlamydiales bacterium]